MKKYLIVLLAAVASIVFSVMLSAMWKSNLSSAAYIEKTKPYAQAYKARKKIESKNLCTDVYGDQCLFYLFDDVQACFGYIESENINLACMYHGDTETYLHLVAPLREPDGEYGA